MIQARVDTIKPEIKPEKRSPFLYKLRKSRLLKVLAVLLVLVLLPRPAAAILPALAVAIGALVSFLTQIFNILKDLIAPVLENIKKLQEKVWKRFDEDIYPRAKIERAQGAAAALQAEMNRIKQQVLDVGTGNARLGPVQQFEARVRARTLQGTEGLEQSYRDIFLPVPDAREAAEDLRRVIDFQDAAVLGAFKESAKIMQAAEAEIRVISQLEDEIKQAPPGAAPILEASAAAALIKSEAITQQALAELLRLGGAQMAARSLEEKRAAQGKNATLKLLQDWLDSTGAAAGARR
jgi:hypothetical protein